MSSENASFLERGVETENLAGFYWNPLESAGICWKPLETTGNHWNLQEMSERVEFHAKLATRGRVRVPKGIVERYFMIYLGHCTICSWWRICLSALNVVMEFKSGLVFVLAAGCL